MSNKKQHVLLTDLHLVSKELEQCYTGLLHAETGGKIWSNAMGVDLESIPKAQYSIRRIPGYFLPAYRPHPGMTLKVHPSVKGYAINLRGVDNIANYVRQQFGKKSDTIRRYVRRLEQCFSIRYVMYHGDLDQAVYDYLMASLKEMIAKRFEIRREKSESLGYWQKLYTTSLPLILEKKASLFVIYHGDRPIALSLNYHYGEVLFGYVSSYALPFSKFGMGHIMIYKLLEWSLKHNVSFFEMGWGDLDYKRRWSNYVYTFKHHLLFPKYSLKANLWNLLQGLKTRGIAFLLGQQVHEHYKIAKRIVRPVPKPKVLINVQVGPIEKSLGTRAENSVQPGDSLWNHLELAIYTFLYQTQEKYGTIKVYQIEDNTFLIQGERLMQRLKIQP